MENVTPNRMPEAAARRKASPRKTLRTTNIRLLIVTAAMCACYAYFVHLPGRERFQELKAQLDAAEWELAESNNLPDRLVDARRRYQDVTKYIHDWKEAAPQASEAASFGAVIAQLVTSTGAQTDRLLPQGEVSFESLGQVPISCEFHGYFSEVFDVLAQLESRPESMWIDEFMVEKQDEQSNPRLHCMIKLAVFTDKLKNSD